MSIPNIGPEHFDEGGSDGVDTPRRGNPPPVLRDEPRTDEVVAASARASTVTHRFGGVRYALTRPKGQAPQGLPPAEEGDSNARE
ncbi:MAG: hypothetical protein ABW156_10975 [Jiangellaceae bacterium]